MSDPTNPAASAAAAPAAEAPAAPTAPAQPPAAEAPRQYLNPYASRPAAPKPVAPAAPTPPPAAPAPDPRVDALLGVLGETVTQDLASLPANVAAAAKAIGGDDPIALRKAINALRANGIATPAPAAPAPLPAPATTLPPSGPAAAAAAPTGDAAVRAEWMSLKQRGAHIAAASFYAANAAAIERGANASN